jgi:5-methyltetrahydropteroyltriglutamate--homocysteine methyltransferase
LAISCWVTILRLASGDGHRENMKTSRERILTTHAGSLPRPPALLQLLRAKVAGQPYDENALSKQVTDAVDGIVRRQATIGVDVVSDGEMPKPSFLHYIKERLGGVTTTEERAESYIKDSREVKAFPEYYAEEAARNPMPPFKRVICNAPLSYIGHAKVQADIALFKAALSKVNVAEGFLPAISPSNVAFWIRNEHYKSDEDYVFALADVMHEEYKAIADAGLVLQVDDPRLVTQYNLDPSLSLRTYRQWAEIRVAALNRALRDIPERQIRFHTCYSIECGPRTTDLELKNVVDIMLKVRAGAYSFETANPRHDHEWKVWRDVKLPDDKILIPGVIANSSVLVEHPELVCDRILRFAEIVGQERVIAGSDCGFGTFAGAMPVHDTIVWAKLEALVTGARLASAKLAPRTAAA